MKIAIITDMHFGVRGDKQAFLDHQEKFFSKIFFPKIDELGINTVFDLGDTFDRRKYTNHVTLKRSREMFYDPMIERGIECHTVVGNHSVYYKNTNEVNSPALLLEGYGNVSVYDKDPVEIEFDGLPIMLCPWITSDNEAIVSEAFTRARSEILMGHFQIEGFEMMKGHMCDYGMSKNAFSKFHSVYSGHFHHPSKYDNITYLGAPYEMTWADYGGKRGFHIFDTDTREMTFVANSFALFHKIHYIDQLTVEDIEEIDVSPLTNAFIKVIVSSRENPYVLDLFLEKVQSVNPADVKVVDDHQNYDLINEDDLVDEAEDTGSIIRKYIDNTETKLDKKKIEDFVSGLYAEASNL